MNKETSSKREDNGQTMYKNVFNFIEAPNNDGSNALNKATFSTAFVRKLLNMYAKPNSLVYDCFMGTGTTAIACIREKHRFVGSEISTKQWDFANERINKELQQLTLF